jgi:anaerobic selenocysteine-containing dehydrogenase
MIRKSACWFCYQNCGLLVEVEGNQPISVEGDPNHPVNEGRRCPRNWAWKEFLYHPERVNYPYKRVGKRGENRWERISWDQALDEIAEKLREIKEKYGAEAVASTGGTNRTDEWPRRRFFNLFGSPNTGRIAPICGLNTYVIESAIYGWVTEPDFSNARTIVEWGHNPGVTYLPEARKVLDAKERGATLIVIDPRFTETASKADLWLQIRPGTDAALALAWINVIVNEGLYDKEFVEKYTYGFEKLKEHVQQYTPSWASKVTWVPEDKIVEAARTFATNKPSVIPWGTSLDHFGLASSPVVQARAILKAITGNLDVPGGNLLNGPCINFITDWELELNEKLPEEQRRKQIGSDRYKLFTWPGYEIISELQVKYWGKAMPSEWVCEAHVPSLWRAIITGKPYPIKALLVVANNPMVCFANTKLVYQALTSPNLELLVVMDYWFTPTALLADYVLPAAFWLERPVITSSFGTSSFFIASHRAIKPLYERRTDFEFWRELGVRLGQGEYWPWKTLEEANSYRISPLGYNDYDEFVEKVRVYAEPVKYRKYVEKGFATPTGKVELYSTILEKLGYDPLPTYREPPESPYSKPVLAKQYPLILTTGTIMPYHHSEGRQLKTLRRLVPDPTVEIHPTTAARIGVKEGDWVYVETRRGRVKVRAKLSKGIDPRVVFLVKGWWFPEDKAEEPYLRGVWKSNANILTEDDPDLCDPLCGGWIYRGLLCRVYKAED